MADLIDDEEKETESGDEEIIEEAMERFQASSDAWSENRKNFTDDIDFTYGEKQWHAEDVSMREAEGRHCLTVNQLPQYIRQVTNDQRQNRPSIKVRAVDDKADPDTAEIIQGLIRHIESYSNADLACDNAFFYSVSGGFGFYRIITDYVQESFEQEILIKPIANSLSVYPDAHAVSFDGSDWNYCFVIDDMTRKDFDKKYGKDTAPFTKGNTGTSDWVQEDTVRVAEYFYITPSTEELHLLDSGEVVRAEDYEKSMGAIEKSRDVPVNKVNWCLIGGDKILEKREWAGRYIPVIPVFGDTVQLGNKRVYQSLIRNSKDAQRMFNYFRTTEAESAALAPKAPWIMAEGQDEGYEDDWKNANRLSLSTLKYKQTDIEGKQAPVPQRVAPPPMPSAMYQGAQNANADIMSTIGMYQSSLGQKSNEQSGKAILARQREGDTSTFHYIDNMARATRYCGIVLLDLIPRIYDTERVVRVLGVDGKEEMKLLNTKHTEPDDYGNPVVRIYDVRVGQYDVTVASGPSYSTLKQESAAAMMEILRSNPDLMPVIGDLAVKAMDWPGAEEISERLQKMLPPNLKPQEDDGSPQMPPEVKAHIDQQDQMLQQASQQIQQMQAELDSKQFEQNATVEKLRQEQEKIDIERMKAQGDLQLKAQSQRPNLDTATDTLTEAEKIQHETELQIRMQEMKEDHEKEMAILNAKLERMRNDEMCGDMGMDMQEQPSAMAVAIMGLQEQMANQTSAFAALIDKMSAPKEIIRDAEGNIIGARTV